MTKKEFNKYFNNNKFAEECGMFLDFDLSNSLKGANPDCVIKNKDCDIVAVIKYQDELNEDSVQRAMEDILKCFSIEEHIFYGIIFHSENECQRVERRGKRAAVLFLPEPFKNILSYIGENYEKIAEDKRNQKVKAKKEALKSLKCIFDKINDKLDAFLNSLVDNNFELDDNIVSLTSEKETTFFSKLLWGDNEQITELTKYCTKEALFRILKDKKQSMASIVNMNDSSEVDYVDRLLDNPNFRWFEDDKERISNIFLMSMVDSRRKDELTPWRLYGDQLRGASITYDYIKAPKDFYVTPVYYIKKQDDQILSAIKKIRGREIIALYYFVFSNWDVWKHFFKSEDYEVEKEYRIIYQRKYDDPKAPCLKWVNDSSTNIIFPIVEFYLRESDIDNDKNKLFPFPIKEIILGSNMPNIDTNKAEIELMLKEFNFQWKVDKSQILNYRG